MFTTYLISLPNNSSINRYLNIMNDQINAIMVTEAGKGKKISVCDEIAERTNTYIILMIDSISRFISDIDCKIRFWEMDSDYKKKLIKIKKKANVIKHHNIDALLQTHTVDIVTIEKTLNAASALIIGWMQSFSRKHFTSIEDLESEMDMISKKFEKYEKKLKKIKETDVNIPFDTVTKYIQNETGQNATLFKPLKNFSSALYAIQKEVKANAKAYEKNKQTDIYRKQMEYLRSMASKAYSIYTEYSGGVIIKLTHDYVRTFSYIHFTVLDDLYEQEQEKK